MAERSHAAAVYSDVLHPILVQDLVRQWLREDTASFDYGGFVVGEKVEKAVLLCKEDCILAGAPFVDAVFAELGCQVEWSFKDGDRLTAPCHAAYVTGKVRNLLIGERIALNCLTRTSGVASFARCLRNIALAEKWSGEVAGTRKTTPGFRLPEKYSLLVGGISTHRYDLSGMIMLKDNHIWTAGNITQAVKDARKVGGFSTKIEVECRSLEEAEEAIGAGSEIVMLDNFDCQTLHETAKILKEKYPHTIVEASGGVTENTIASYMGPHVDVISLSKTTQGYRTVDFSFKILKDGKDPRNPLVKKNY